MQGSETEIAKCDSYNGIMHFVSNKVLMQRPLCDGVKPTLLLIPCLTMDEAKAWNGDAYSAVAVAGLPNCDRILPYTCEECTVYLDAGLAKEQLYQMRKVASPEQIVLAQHLLTDTMMALADLIHKCSVGHSPSFPEAVKTFFHIIRRDRDWEKIPLPSSQVDPNTEALGRVCLVSFESHTSRRGHPAPDPLLLSMKAAVVWSYMANFRMMANGKKEDDYCDDSEAIDELLMEEIPTDDEMVNEDASRKVSIFELPMQLSH